MSLSREVQNLIDSYADGNLSKEEVQNLAKLLEKSDEVREQLAFAAVLERLLRTMGRGSVSTGQIMSQVKEYISKVDRERTNPSTRPQRRLIVPGGIKGPGGGARQRRKDPLSVSRAVLIACLLVITLFTGTFMWRKWEEIKPSDPDPDVSFTTTTTTSKPMTTNTDASAGNTNKKVEPVHVAQALKPFLPIELPPPAGEDLSPPSDNGENEQDFVPPPKEWITAARKALLLSEEPLDPRKVPRPKAPLLCMKVRHGGLREWGATPDDVSILLKDMEKTLGVRYGMKLQLLDNLEINPKDNPILFFTGHYHFILSRTQRSTLRRFILGGGMIIFNSGLGSKPFYDSAKREMRLILPELPIEKLGPDHPIFHANYELLRVNYCKGVRDAGYSGTQPWLEGITLSCRTAVVISRWGMAAGWEGKENDAFRAYRSKDAKRLGINLMTYGASIRAWVKRTSHLSPFTESLTSDTGSMFMAQIKYNGEWRTRYAGLIMLLHTFNQRTTVPVKLGVRSMKLTDSGLFNMPILYLTGHESLVLDKEERDMLKQYLKNGGFLFAEACCGRKGFDRDFRVIMAQLFPSKPLTAIPSDNAIFRIPNEIELLGVTPALGATYGSMLIQPGLEGIKMDNNYVVIYSPHGMAGSWEMTQTPYASGYEDPDTLKLGQNILMYAITQ